jgi:hypothetical protein
MPADRVDVVEAPVPASTIAGKRAHKPRPSSHSTDVSVPDGNLSCAGTVLGRRDSTGIWGVEEIDCQATVDATDVLFVEVMMTQGDVVGD